MRSFEETSAAMIGDEEYEASQFGETNWLSPSAIVGKYNMILLSTNTGNNGYGEKTFVHWIIEGDPDAVEYTSSFSQKSKVWDQCVALQLEHAKSGNVFPLRCSVAMVGKTYKLIGPMHQQAATVAASAGPERAPAVPRPAIPNQRKPQPAPSRQQQTPDTTSF